MALAIWLRGMRLGATHFSSPVEYAWPASSRHIVAARSWADAQPDQRSAQDAASEPTGDATVCSTKCLMLASILSTLMDTWYMTLLVYYT